MSREPTAEQIEAVVTALWETIPFYDHVDEQDIRNVVLAAMNAEPLTSTPEPSTTETGRQPIIQLGAGLTGSPLGPQQFDPPPGYEYEYRTALKWESGSVTHSEWHKERDHEFRVFVTPGHDPEAWLERRLVGPPERIEDE